MIDNGNWTRVKCNLVINHKHDFSAKCEFDLKSQVIFHTKIARYEVQLPLYYSHFEIAEFSQYQILLI